MTLKSFVKRTLQRPANLLVSSSSNIPANIYAWLKESVTTLLMEEPAMAAKFLPYQGGKVDYILDPITEPETSGIKGLPVPPKDLWQGYAPATESFLRDAGNRVKKT